MSVEAVNYGTQNPLARVINSTLIGGVIGYGAKYAIKLQKSEKKDINYAALVNSSRKDVNLKKVNSFKILKSRTPAQDEFINMIEHKENFKNPTLADLAERVGGKATEISKKVLQILADEKNKNIDVNGIVEALGKDTKEAKEFKYASSLTNCFADYNLARIVKKLGGEKSNAGQEFMRIIEEVDKQASFVTRKLLKATHYVIKSKRYTAPLVAAGATAGFAVAFIQNMLAHKTEA